MENKYPIGGYAPGNYHCKCCTCGNMRTLTPEEERALEKTFQKSLKDERRAAPTGGVWVKATSRLPGYTTPVKWRQGEIEMKVKAVWYMILDTNSEYLSNCEWLDESGEKDDWISVNDRLPYKDGDSSIPCLVIDIVYGTMVRPFNEAHVCWDQEGGDDYYCDAKGGKITHWRPLPEPPKR